MFYIRSYIGFNLYNKAFKPMIIMSVVIYIILTALNMCEGLSERLMS